MSPELPPGDPTLELPFAHEGPVLEGCLRASPEDFVVEEELGYQASGAGEHVFLTVRKRGRNTQEVARAIWGTPDSLAMARATSCVLRPRLRTVRNTCSPAPEAW